VHWVCPGTLMSPFSVGKVTRSYLSASYAEWSRYCFSAISLSLSLCVCVCSRKNWETTDQKSTLLGWNSVTVIPEMIRFSRRMTSPFDLERKLLTTWKLSISARSDTACVRDIVSIATQQTLRGRVHTLRQRVSIDPRCTQLPLKLTVSRSVALPKIPLKLCLLPVN